MECRGPLQDLITNVGQLELAYFPIKGWIIEHNVHGLLDGPGDIMHLSTYYGEIVHPDTVSRGVTMVIDGGRGPKMLLEPFPKSPC